ARLPRALCSREGQRDCTTRAKTCRENERTCLHVIASHPVGAKRRRMTGSAKQSNPSICLRSHGLLPPSRKGASADCQPGVACAASVDGSSLQRKIASQFCRGLLAMTAFWHCAKMIAIIFDVH